MELLVSFFQLEIVGAYYVANLVGRQLSAVIRQQALFNVSPVILDFLVTGSAPGRGHEYTGYLIFCRQLKHQS
jgi:hypothetical protein